MFESEFLTSTENSRLEYQRLIAQAAEVVCASLPRQPYSGKSPQALAETIDPPFLRRQMTPWNQIAQSLRHVVENSIVVSNPHTAAHLHCPPLLASLAAEIVISALNQSMDSFDQAPIATILEQKMIRWLCFEAGLPAAGDGTFTTGGSQSNYMGLLLARDAFLQKHWNWSAQKSGLPPEARRLRILCSEVAHFTVEKSASQLGLGTDSVIRIEVDDHFRMRPGTLNSALENLSQQGLFPMAVVATAGTTDFGSIDPLAEVGALARQAGAWFHIDAAYGGALFFASQHRSKVAGIEVADSVSIDFHKLFWQPISCGAFLVRDAGHFNTIKFHADYLNPAFYEDQGIPNLVTTSLLTSRRFDALKLWVSFQSLGREKFGAMVDHTITLAHDAAQIIRATRELELMCEPQLSTVVFRYVPQTESDADKINSAIRQELFDRGRAVIGQTRVKGRQCLKFTCLNPTASKADMRSLLEMIHTCGAEICGR